MKAKNICGFKLKKNTPFSFLKLQVLPRGNKELINSSPTFIKCFINYVHCTYILLFAQLLLSFFNIFVVLQNFETKS